MNIFIILFAVAAGLLAAFSFFSFFKLKEGKPWFVFLLGFAAVCALNCVAVLEHSNFFRFSFLNFTYLAFFVFLGFLVSHYVKTEKMKKLADWLFSAVFLFFITIRFFYDIPLYHKIPLNICNISTLLIIVRPLFKSKMTESYMAFFTIAGVLMNIFLGEFYGNGFEFFYLEGFISNSLHFFFISYIIYLFSKKDVQMDRKSAIKNAVWIVPYYVLLVFLNQIFEYNYFFTSKFRNPILFLYNLFPTFNATISGFTFEFNLIYYAVLLVGVLALLFFFAWIFEAVKNRKQTINE